MTIHLAPELEFVNRITVVMQTATGTRTGWCDFPGLPAPVCVSSTDGALVVGQTYTLTARASIAVSGTGTPADQNRNEGALGRWRVYVTSP